MKDQERVYISYVEESHPLLQELPEEYRKLWFQGFENKETKNILFLQMERIYKDPQQTKFLDVLTLEIADMDALLEWEEEFPDKKFVAIDPYTVFFDGIDEQNRGMVSVGEINLQSLQFIPELEIYITPHPQGILVDFQDGTVPEVWYKR